MKIRDELPYVSALIVIRNEEQFIKTSLMSLVDQDYPNDRYEIIVIDGESSDNTLKIIEEIKTSNATNGVTIRIINNDKQTLASGWNIGINHSNGEYIVRIDAHAKAMPNFITKSVETILQVDAACVGGKLITKTLSRNSDVISRVLSSPFGVGNSSFRTTNKAGFVDTAVYGLYKKEIFEEVGLFDERYRRNQDLQMHSRIKKVGGRFYFNPEILSEYYTRNTLKKMMFQGYENGLWNMRLLKEDPKALSIRHIIPLLFVLFIIAVCLAGFISKAIWILGIVVLLIYFTLGLISSIKSGARKKDIYKMLMAFFLLHSSYGIGSLFGIFSVS